MYNIINGSLSHTFFFQILQFKVQLFFLTMQLLKNRNGYSVISTDCWICCFLMLLSCKAHFLLRVSCNVFLQINLTSQTFRINHQSWNQDFQPQRTNLNSNSDFLLPVFDNYSWPKSFSELEMHERFMWIYICVKVHACEWCDPE